MARCDIVSMRGQMEEPDPQDLLTRLNLLLPAQMEEVIFRLNLQTSYLSSQCAPTSKAIDVIKLAEQAGLLRELADNLARVTAAARPFHVTKETHGPSSTEVRLRQKLTSCSGISPGEITHLVE